MNPPYFRRQTAIQSRLIGLGEGRSHYLATQADEAVPACESPRTSLTSDAGGTDAPATIIEIPKRYPATPSSLKRRLRLKHQHLQRTPSPIDCCERIINRSLCEVADRRSQNAGLAKLR
jgi:hypothetical protein